MSVATELQKRIEKKQQEIVEMEVYLREQRAYLQALIDTAKLMPKDGTAREPKIRPNSMVAKAREVLQRNGQPMHVANILEGMGRNAGKKERLSLSGSLSQYVRDGEIFSRPEPNVFGLLEWQQQPLSTPEAVEKILEGKDVTEVLDKMR